MAKVSIEEVAAELAAEQVDEKVRAAVIARLNQIIEEEKLEREAEGPKPKQEFIIVSTDPKFDPNTPLFIAKMDEGENFNELPDRIGNAAKAFNTSQQEKKRRQRKPAILTVGAAFEHLKPKEATAHGFRIVAKTPVIAVTMGNDLRAVAEVPGVKSDED